MDVGTILDFTEEEWKDPDQAGVFRKKYKNLIVKLGGPEAVQPYLPFSLDELAEQYKEDPNMNQKQKSWDRAAGCVDHWQGKVVPTGGGVWPLLRRHGYTASSVSRNVCLLKCAAEWLLEKHQLIPPVGWESGQEESGHA